MKLQIIVMSFVPGLVESQRARNERKYILNMLLFFQHSHVSWTNRKRINYISRSGLTLKLYIFIWKDLCWDSLRHNKVCTWPEIILVCVIFHKVLFSLFIYFDQFCLVWFAKLYVLLTSSTSASWRISSRSRAG